MKSTRGILVAAAVTALIVAAGLSLRKSNGLAVGQCLVTDLAGISLVVIVDEVNAETAIVSLEIDRSYKEEFTIEELRTYFRKVECESVGVNK